jgi:hypothetical protein
MAILYNIKKDYNVYTLVESENKGSVRILEKLDFLKTDEKTKGNSLVYRLRTKTVKYKNKTFLTKTGYILLFKLLLIITF